MRNTQPRTTVKIAALVLGAAAMLCPGLSVRCTDGPRDGGQQQVVRDRRARDKGMGGHEHRRARRREAALHGHREDHVSG